jgi:kumamolisin
VSAIFPPPDWQDSADVPPSANPGSPAGRGVPDIAGDADPATGYVTRVDGLTSVAGGTSAVAPLWAGLLARINQARGGRPVGYINPLLYSAEARGATRDITQGSNGAYRARGGWDACTGWGTPKGRALAALLGGDTLADTDRGVTDDREPEPPPEPPADTDDLDDARPM